MYFRFLYQQHLFYIHIFAVPQGHRRRRLWDMHGTVYRGPGPRPLSRGHRNLQDRSLRTFHMGPRYRLLDRLRADSSAGAWIGDQILQGGGIGLLQQLPAVMVQVAFINLVSLNTETHPYLATGQAY